MLESRAVTVWHALDAWAETLCTWQQYIIGRAVSNGRLSAEQLADAYTLFLAAQELGEPASLDTPPTSVRSGNGKFKPLWLVKIDGLAGINALPDGSELTFDPKLTVIYGRNGAGKSGFARLFANACFSRVKPQIMSNIYATEKAAGPRAAFHVTLDGVPDGPLAFSPGTEHADLQRVSVFDVTTASLRVSQTTPLEFRPSGFDVFSEMARVYGELGKLVAAAIQSRTHSTRISDSFIGQETEITKLVSGLAATTDLHIVRKLAIYGEAEKARLQEVDAQLTALKANSPQALIANLEEANTDLAALAAKLGDLESHFLESKEAFRTSLSKTAEEHSATAAAIGTETFKRPFFSAVGSPEWEAFAKAAHSLARKESLTYPDIEDPCILCERPLGKESRAHIADLLAFVEGEAQRNAQSAVAAVDDEIAHLRKLDLDVFAEDSRVRAQVQKLEPELAISINERLQEMVKLRESTISALRSRQPLQGSANCADLCSALGIVMDHITADLYRLEKEDHPNAIASLQLERQTLRHREVLSKLLSSIEMQVADAVWCAKAERAKSALNPRHITEKEKELFAEIVGPSYRKRLEEECEALECDMPIELQTSGQKGHTVRALLLKGGYRPESILSEGEQKAVALADFLTEVCMNPESAAIVLDDPVTSQDHQRKQLIAKRLVRESGARQVIVFTHDLPFLNELVMTAEAEDISFQAHWIDRDNEGNPGHITLNDAPVTSKSYDSTERARQCLAQAQTLSGRPRHDAICKGMGALRRTIEECVAKRLLKSVVPRWSDRVIVTGLRNIAWDDGLADKMCAMYEELSKYIDGHSHTDEGTGAPPEIKDLVDLIPRVDALIRASRQDRKAQRAAGSIPAGT